MPESLHLPQPQDFDRLEFDDSAIRGAAAALHVTLAAQLREMPAHRHRLGQLVLALQGGVDCQVPGALWMVPAGSAVWIPPQLPHSVQATADARLAYLFVQPQAARLPQACCALAVSPLVRELVLDLAAHGEKGGGGDPVMRGHHARKVAVLLQELTYLPTQDLRLPVPGEPRLQRLARELADDPADRRTLAQWADRLALGERSLARLVQRETGLTFGRWRQQLHLLLALRQLAAGAPVQAVAGALGYASVTAFITMFRKALGCTPAQYFGRRQRAGHEKGPPQGRA